MHRQHRDVSVGFRVPSSAWKRYGEFMTKQKEPKEKSAQEKNCLNGNVFPDDPRLMSSIKIR